MTSEKLMWWKEIGKLICADKLKKDDPTGAALYTAYFGQMLASLEIKVNKKGE